MNKTTTGSRIEFIDLAKGVCILLVVMGHCNVDLHLPGLSVLRMPLYFILSGLFFKEYGGFIDFTIKKINNILIPFLFFYILGYAAFYVLKLSFPSLLVTDAKGILDVFTNRQLFNGPIWFLLALFWCNLMFFGVNKIAKSDILKISIVGAIGGMGYVLGRNDIFFPAFIDVSMTSLPFFAIGYYLKKSNLLYPDKSNLVEIALSIMFYGLAVLVSYLFSFRLAFHYNGFNGLLPGYVVAISSVAFVLLLCKQIRYIPVVCYMGRYSIIVLCTHHMIYRPLRVLFTHFSVDWLSDNWVLFIATSTLSYCMIPLCIKYIPWFVAQRGLIKINTTY